MRLLRGHIYLIKYYNYNEDKYPHLFVIRTTKNDVWGLNLHYLPKVYDKSFKVRVMLEWNVWLKLYEKGYVKKFLQEMNQEWFDTAKSQDVLMYLQRKHPRVMENCFRHYKKNMIEIVKEYKEEGK